MCILLQFQQKSHPIIEYIKKCNINWNVKRFSMLNISQVIPVRTDSNLCRKELTVHWSAPNSLIRSYLQPCTNSKCGGMKVKVWLPVSDYWPALRAGLLCCNFFGQPGSVSKFPPFVWVKLWVGWVGRGYTEISRYFPASWINWVTLVTKIKLLYSLRF